MVGELGRRKVLALVQPPLGQGRIEERDVDVVLGLVQRRISLDLVLERVQIHSLLLLEQAGTILVVVWAWELLVPTQRIWLGEMEGRSRSGVGLELVQRLKRNLD